MIKSNYKSGFTLIEVLLAAAILVFAVFSSFLLLKTVTREILNSCQLTKSAYISEAKLEELKSVAFDDISNKSFAQDSGKIEVRPVLSDLKEIKVELFWHKRRKPIQIYTLRSRY